MLSRVLILLILFGFFSCDQNRVFDKYQSIPNQWSKDSLVKFEFDLKANSYNTFINIRKDKNYKFNNLFFCLTFINFFQFFLNFQISICQQLFVFYFLETHSFGCFRPFSEAKVKFQGPEIYFKNTDINIFSSPHEAIFR
jgi:hypothetical protein